MLIYPDELGSIAYIGQTIQSMRSRFYNGIIGQGYKWSKMNNSYSLFVWDVDEFTDVDSQDLDAIESELTFAARLNQGCWPLHQTAIKFRWFRQSNTARHAPYIVMGMMNDLYTFLSKRNKEDKQMIEGQRQRIIHLLEQAVI